MAESHESPPGSFGGPAVLDDLLAPVCPGDHKRGDPEEAAEARCLPVHEESSKLSGSHRQEGRLM